MVEPLEELQHRISRTWSPVSHLNAVLNSDALRAGYNACLPLLSAYQTDLAQSEPLFRAYRTVAEQEGAALAPVQRQLLEHRVRDFRLAGVGLSAQRKESFKTAMLELTQLQAKFEENVLDATNHWNWHVRDSAELAGLNEMLIEQARRRAARARPARLGAQPRSADLRGGGDGCGVARCCGAPSTRPGPRAPPIRDRTPAAGTTRAPWRRSCSAGMRRRGCWIFATTPSTRSPRAWRPASRRCCAFLHELAGAARAAAQAEFAELEAFAGRKLAAWDVGFYAERLQRQRFSVSQEELRPYFPLPRVLAGLFEVAERLFGVRIRERHGAPVWHPDARLFDIENSRRRGGRQLLPGRLRAPQQAQRRVDGRVRRPQAPGQRRARCRWPTWCATSCRPGGERPALLTHDDVLTLFHEFGHGLHHLLTRVDYPSIAGINGVAWDAVELPSQFLENYAWHPEVLQRISGHFESGAPLPAEQQQRLIATRSFHAGLQMMRQLEFALFDFRIHTEYSPEHGGRILEILREVRAGGRGGAGAGVEPLPEQLRPHLRRRLRGGLLQLQVGRGAGRGCVRGFRGERRVRPRHRAALPRSILSRGGSRDALDAFIDFRGRRPDVRALLKQHGILGAVPHSA